MAKRLEGESWVIPKVSACEALPEVFEVRAPQITGSLQDIVVKGPIGNWNYLSGLVVHFDPKRDVRKQVVLTTRILNISAR